MTASTAGDARHAYKVLMPLVRERLWPPDGKPPKAWDERREGSVLKRLLSHRSVSQIEVAILGLAQLREQGLIEWLKPGQKVTSRALYNTRSGYSQMFELATRAYWSTVKRTPKRQNWTSVGDILMHALRQSEDYKTYLRSPEWRVRREQVIAKAGNRCQQCRAYGVPLEAHHLRYTNLGAEPDEDLAVLCKTCHQAADAERAARTYGAA